MKKLSYSWMLKDKYLNYETSINGVLLEVYAGHDMGMKV